MFYQTFSGTLGFAAAIGAIVLFVLFVGNKYIWNKKEKEEDEGGVLKGRLLNNLERSDLFEWSSRLLLISVAFLLIGAFSKSTGNILIPKEGIMFLGYSCLALSALMILTMDWN
jgi:hypothetical protein